MPSRTPRYLVGLFLVAFVARNGSRPFDIGVVIDSTNAWLCIAFGVLSLVTPSVVVGFRFLLETVFLCVLEANGRGGSLL